MRKHVRYILLGFLALFTVLGISCKKGGASWDTDISAPIFKTNFGIDNLVADSLLSRNSDSSLTLVYHNSLYNFSLDSLFHIPDTTLSNNYHIPFGSAIFNPGQAITPVPNNSSTYYYLNGVGLKTAKLHSGKMRVSIRNRVHSKILFNYQIPCASLNNVPFSVTVLIPAFTNSNTPGIYTAEYDLSGYDIDLSGLAHNSINTLVTAMNANIDPAAPSQVTVVAADSIVISNSFVNMVPEYAKGYFGQTVQMVGPAENSVGIFNKIISGSIQLSSVTMNFSLENSIGVDARINMTDIYSKNSRTGNIVHLTAPFMNNPININRAVETHSSPPVASTLYTNTLNNTNSNVKTLFENLPDKFGYQLSITPNPLGNVSGYNDFIYYGYGLKANLDFQMPLSLVANNLTLADTVPVNFDAEADNLSRLHKANLTLYAENGFPLDAAVQLYIYDPLTNAKDSLLGSVNTIDEAPIDLNYKAVGQRQTILEIPVTGDKISKMIRTKKMVILVRFNTAAKPNYLKIYSNYQMNFRLTGDFNYTVKLH